MVKINNQFGIFIKYLRTSHNPPYSQRELAEQLTKRGFYTAASAIGHWENENKGAIPDGLKNPEFVRTLGNILDAKPVDIYRAAGFLEGMEMSGGDDLELLHFIEKLTPEQRQHALEILKVAIIK